MLLRIEIRPSQPEPLWFAHFRVLGDRMENPSIIRKEIDVDLVLPKPFAQLQSKWSEMYFDIYEVVRHELEHANQYHTKFLGAFRHKSGPGSLKSYVEYLTHPFEIPAFVTGIYFAAKKQHKPFTQMADEYIRKLLHDNYPFHKSIGRAVAMVKRKWFAYTKTRYPDVM